MPSPTPHTFLVALITLLLVTHTLARGPPCPSFCRYRLCARLLRDGTELQRENRLFSMSFPDEPLGPFPCIERNGGFVQPLRNVTGGEALVASAFSADNFVPISEYTRDSRTANFSKGFFRWVRNTETRESAVQRMRLTGEQKTALDGLCVRMPISSFLKRNSDGVLKRVRTKGSSACVGFRPVATRLNVKFEWSSSNDFDLRLREPGGFEINRFGSNYESVNGGKLVKDNGARTCQVVLGKEQIVYGKDDSVEKGVYRVAVNHFRVCEAVSRYRLRVLYEERVVFEETGVVGLEHGADIIVRSFRID